MTKAISPALTCLEDSLRRTPLDDPYDQSEVNILWSLMIEEITCPAGHYNLELRFLHNEIRLLSEVMGNTAHLEDSELFNLNPEEWKEFGAAFWSVPMTRRECSNRMSAIRSRMADLHNLIDVARAGGVYYDVCELLDWFATPPAMRTTNSPSNTLAFFGRQLFGLLGMAAQNTEWAHIEAVTSRQIAPRFGGDYMENEKTRFRELLPGQANNNNPGVVSSAPR